LLAARFESAMREEEDALFNIDVAFFGAAAREGDVARF
jgi:hypothetical protein